MGHLTKLLSALLTLCPSRNLLWQRASYIATSISPSLGDPGETCRQSRGEPQRRQECFHTFPTHKLPTSPYLSWDQGSHSNRQLRLVASNRPGTAPTDEKRNPLLSDIGCINHNQPELETFNGNIGHNSRPPSPAKTALISASRVRPTSKETPTLVRLPYAEKTLKSFSSTRQSEAQMK